MKNFPETLKADAVVIGAGIMGCATALELQQKGFRTIVVDKDCGLAQGSTSFSTGIIRTYYSLEETTKLAFESSFYFLDFPEYVRLPHPAEFSRCPSLLIRHTNNEDWIQSLIDNHQKLNIPFEEWGKERLETELPWMSWSSYYPPRRIDDEQFGEESNDDVINGALYLKESSGFVSNPQLAAQNIGEAAKREGVEFFFRRAVTRIQKGDRGVVGVELSDGTHIDSPIVINAAGPHSAHVSQMAFDEGIKSDMQLTTKPLRVEVAHVRLPEDIDYSKENGFIMCDSNVGIYMRPDVKGKLVIGGQEPACDPLHFFENYDDNDHSFTDEWVHHIYRANLRIPNLGVPNSSQAQGIVSAYDVTEDWVPIYDRSNLPGYFMCIGTSGNQFKNGPVVGKIMASIVSDTVNGRDTDKDPIQFPLERSGLGTLNLGVFTRLRDPQKTSGTVMG